LTSSQKDLEFARPRVAPMAKQATKFPEVVIQKLAKKEVLEFFPVIHELRTTLTKKDLVKRLNAIRRISGHYFWGALRGKTRVGFCHASISINLSPGGKDLYLNDLVITEKSRGGGIGSRLIETVIAFARREKCQRILVTVRTSNRVGMRLYKQKGFERRGWARLVRDTAIN